MFLINKTSKSTELSCILCDFNKSTYKDIDICCEISRVQIDDRVQIDVGGCVDCVSCVSYAGYVSCAGYVGCASCASCVSCVDSVDYERCKECGCEYGEFCAHYNHHNDCCTID